MKTFKLILSSVLGSLVYIFIVGLINFIVNAIIVLINSKMLFFIIANLFPLISIYFALIAANYLYELISMAICKDEYLMHRSKLGLGIILTILYGLSLISILIYKEGYSSMTLIMFIAGLYFIYKYKNKENC